MKRIRNMAIAGLAALALAGGAMAAAGPAASAATPACGASCFAFASQPAAIFFARSSVIVGLVSMAIAAEPNKLRPPRRPQARQIIFICVPSINRWWGQHFLDGSWLYTERAPVRVMAQSFKALIGLQPSSAARGQVHGRPSPSES